MDRVKAFISEKFPSSLLFLVTSYFPTHPLTLLLQVLGGRLHGRPPPLILEGTLPQSPPKSPPMRSHKRTNTHTVL